MVLPGKTQSLRQVAEHNNPELVCMAKDAKQGFSRLMRQSMKKDPDKNLLFWKICSTVPATILKKTFWGGYHFLLFNGLRFNFYIPYKIRFSVIHHNGGLVCNHRFRRSFRTRWIASFWIVLLFIMCFQIKIFQN